MSSNDSFRTALLLFVSLFLSFNLSAGEQAAVEDQGRNATVLMFQVQEPGTGVYAVTMTINERFLRIDDDPDSGYVLFDRSRRVLFSVSHGDRTILEIHASDTAASPPDSFMPETIVERDDAAPAIAGTRPLHVRLNAGGRTCYEVITVPGMLDQSVSALTEYAQLLGGQQVMQLKNIPADIRTPCYLLRYAYGTTLPLRNGMPIREWDGAGYTRELVNYRENAPVDASLFALPEGYQRYGAGD